MSTDILELEFYHVQARNMGLTIFSTQNLAVGGAFFVSQIPVIHNYPLTLALSGVPAEESYVSAHGQIKYRLRGGGGPASLFRELHFYVYPLMLTRVYVKVLTLSMSGSEGILYKPRSRLAVPVLAKYEAFMPGTEGETFLVSDREWPEKLLIRLGVKRAGVWSLRLRKVEPRRVEHHCRISSPFNVADSKNLVSYVTVLPHYAGDLAVSGEASSCIELRLPGDKSASVYLPEPRLWG